MWCSWHRGSGLVCLQTAGGHPDPPTSGEALRPKHQYGDGATCGCASSTGTSCATSCRTARCSARCSARGTGGSTGGGTSGGGACGGT